MVLSAKQVSIISQNKKGLGPFFITGIELNIVSKSLNKYDND